MQAWGAFLQRVADALFAPFHAMLGAIGLERTDAQIIALLVAVAVAAGLVARAVIDRIMASRRALAEGRVVAVFHNADGPTTPRIRFLDASGRTWTFDSDRPWDDACGHVGAIVPVIYDPKDPSRAREAGREALRKRHYALGVLVASAMLWYAFSTPAPF